MQSVYDERQLTFHIRQILGSNLCGTSLSETSHLSSVREMQHQYLELSISH